MLLYTTIKLVKSIIIAGIVNHSNIETSTRFFIGDYFGDPLYTIMVLLEQISLIVAAYFYITQKRYLIFKTVNYLVLIQIFLTVWFELNNILFFNSVVGLLLYSVYQYDNIKNKFKAVNFKSELLLLSYALFFIQYFFETLYFRIELASDLSYSYIIIATIAYFILISTDKRLSQFFYNVRILFFLIPLTIFMLLIDKNPTFKIMYFILTLSYIILGYLIYKLKFRIR